MATRIIWDEEPTAPEPKPEPKEEWVPSPKSPTVLSPEAHRALFLGTVKILELITELNKRGYVVHDSRGLYTPTTVTTSPYTPTITTTSGTYVSPTITYNGLGQASSSTVSYGSAEYYSQLMQNVATLGKSK